MEPINVEKRQSVLIEAMRFPLIYLVLVIHVLPEDLKPVALQPTSMNAYRFVSEMISHNVGRIAVPCFFIFSGFFFFRRMETWSAGFYTSQLRKRVSTLLIPYVLWNLLLLAIVYIKAYVFTYLSIDQHDEITFLEQHNIFQLLWLPIDLPLWYIRDLICMTLLTPLFYYAFKFGKIFAILALTVIYLSKWELPIPGFSTTAFMYFGAGAYFGMYKKNLLIFSRRMKYLSYIAAPPLLLMATYYNGVEPQHEYIIRVFVLMAVIASINIMDKVIENEKIKNFLIKLSPTVFFIYAIHEFYIKNWLKGFFYRTSLAESGWGMFAGYLVMPVITLLICLGLYYLWKKFSPRSLGIFLGGRISTPAKG